MSFTVVLAIVSMGGLAATAASRLLVPDRPEGCTAPQRSMDLYAVQLPSDPATGKLRLGYGTTPKNASYPGPTIEMVEGHCLDITLHNRVPSETLAQLRKQSDHPLGVSLHVHGVKYNQKSDGTAQSGSFVPPGESRTYTWFAKAPDPRTGSPGTAGYWWYHDHVVGTAHGTQGVGAGLFGGLVVRRPGDPKPDRTYVTAFGDDHTINLRKGAATDTCDEQAPRPGPTCIVARQGEKVEFIVLGIGNGIHTFHLHGHSWADTRTGMVDRSDPWAEPVRIIDNRLLGPGDSFGFQVTAGESSGPGTWMLHCHVQIHSDDGMSTMMHVLDEDGDIPLQPQHAPTEDAANHAH